MTVTQISQTMAGVGGLPPYRTGEDPWTPEEVGELQAELEGDAARLRREISVAETGIADLLRDSGEGAGDDQADAGTKNFEREHEMAIANNAREMLQQTERALARLAAGHVRGVRVLRRAGRQVPAAGVPAGHAVHELQAEAGTALAPGWESVSPAAPAPGRDLPAVTARRSGCLEGRVCAWLQKYARIQRWARTWPGSSTRARRVPETGAFARSGPVATPEPGVVRRRRCGERGGRDAAQAEAGAGLRA